jgi:hypothetical protein
MSIREESGKLNRKMYRKIRHMVPNNREFNAEKPDLTQKLSAQSLRD